MRSSCQSFDHDMNSCPYYEIFDELYARLNAMILTLNKQYKCFVGEMREFGLLSENDLFPLPTFSWILVYLSLNLRLVSMTIVSLPSPRFQFCW